jgi:hypothetical protein
MPIDGNQTVGTNSNTEPGRGKHPNRPGPYIGTVMENYDPTRSGMIKVWIEELSFNKPEAIPVRYMTPYYSHTKNWNTSESEIGKFAGSNPHAYGMWFPAPDIGTKVMVIFVNGDHNQGYYIGAIPEPHLLHMVPTLGTGPAVANNPEEEKRFGKNAALPTVEMNDKNPGMRDNSRFFDSKRPMHSILNAQLFQQGVIKDTVRGPLNSNCQRESPSNVFGLSTPGRPIYKSGANDYNIHKAIKKGSRPDFDIIGRTCGHSFILDDGDLQGETNTVRLRTGKGHQITMSDDGNTIHIMHANGQSWVELGNEGSVDVYAANSVNVRTEGTLNFHADEDINMYAGKKINMHSVVATSIESEKDVNIVAEEKFNTFAREKVIVRSDGTLSIHADDRASVNSVGTMVVNGSTVQLNSQGPLPAPKPKFIVRTKLPNTSYHKIKGWTSAEGALSSICSRAPTHEPYAHHNKGIPTKVDYNPGTEPSVPLQVRQKKNEYSKGPIRKD